MDGDARAERGEGALAQGKGEVRACGGACDAVAARSAMAWRSGASTAEREGAEQAKHARWLDE